MVENIDLAKTFAAIGGTGLPGDGHSLLSLLHGSDGGGWRDAALIEHRGTDKRGLDPDFQQTSGGSPRTYEAMRTRSFLYVEYDDGEREFYDLRTDPYELHNLARRLTPAQRTLLHLSIRAIVRCHGGTECWRAMHVEGDLTGSSPAAPLP
jgi:arylsulfatase A-like enzyme